MSTLTVIEKKNGDKAICIPVESLKNVQIVTLQKDGEIRCASVGPLAPQDAILFSNAVRLALYLSNSEAIFGTGVGCGLSWNTRKDDV